MPTSTSVTSTFSFLSPFPFHTDQTPNAAYRCKKHVNADKQFTLHEAPAVLCVHLKRFSPMGRKLGQPIQYRESLSLKPYMSEGSYGPSYTLYGVICHAGGGPNSGHYFAHIKNAKGVWHEMNDEHVSRDPSPPTSLKNAYILFYIRDKGQALDAVISSSTSSSSAPMSPLIPRQVLPKRGVVASMKKRKVVESEDEDDPPTTQSSKTFIGPRLPSPHPSSSSAPADTPLTPGAKKQKPNPVDPQAETLKKKIAAAASKSPASNALASLAQYTDGSSDDDLGEKVEPSSTEDKKDDEEDEDKKDQEDAPKSPSISAQVLAPASPTAPASPPAPAPAPLATPGLAPVPATSFYGTSASTTKRKGKGRDDSGKKKFKSSDDSDSDDEQLRRFARTPISPVSTSGGYKGNPFSRMKGSNNLSEKRDSFGLKRKKRLSRAV